MRCATWTSSPYSKYFDDQSDDLRSPPSDAAADKPKGRHEVTEEISAGYKQTNRKRVRRHDTPALGNNDAERSHAAATCVGPLSRGFASLVHEVDRGGVHEHAPLVLRHELVLARVRRQRCKDALPTRVGGACDVGRARCAMWCSKQGDGHALRWQATGDVQGTVFMLDFLEPGATLFGPAASVIFGPSFQDGVGFVSARMGILGFWPVAILEWEPTRHGPLTIFPYSNQCMAQAGAH
jgi:hypothetical protein